MALISYITGDCPGCGAKNRFGNVDVYSRYIYRGCGVCRYNQKVPLPEVRKKVLYLDQFFFSHAFRGNDERFIEAASRIRRLTANQQLVVPFSSIHEEETHQWARYAELMDFIKRTSGGHELHPAYKIEQAQLQKAMTRWLKGLGDDYECEEREALRDDVHVWDGYMWIDVGGYHGDRELVRTLKAQAVDSLIDTFEGWRKSTNTFEQDVMLEHKAAATGYVQYYLGYVKRIMAGDFMAQMDSPIMSQVVRNLQHVVPKELDWFATVLEFFKTSHFHNAPYQDIGSKMFATLKMLVKGGAYQNREQALRKLSGFFGDVKHISTYAPYCDAILIDAPMHELVGRKQVDLAGRYGVKVFSRSNWGEMLAWFDEVEAGMTEEHRAALEVAYP